jgi:hypothetical protein
MNSCSTHKSGPSYETAGTNKQMNTNEILIWSSSLMALLLYYPLISGIIRGEIKQSVASWIFWLLLDSIALVSIIFQ